MDRATLLKMIYLINITDFASEKLLVIRESLESWKLSMFCAIKDNTVLSLDIYEENITGDYYLWKLDKLVSKAVSINLYNLVATRLIKNSGSIDCK